MEAYVVYWPYMSPPKMTSYKTQQLLQHTLATALVAIGLFANASYNEILGAFPHSSTFNVKSSHLDVSCNPVTVPLLIE
jgi:hypothetical protein